VSYRRNSVSCKEPEVSLSYSQKADAGICHESHEPNQNLSIVEDTF
jgi:hypothetical protein